MEQQTTNDPIRGIGKESQLSRISASINTASAQEANPSATQSMIASFVKKFDATALEIIQTMDDDQEDLIKKMVDEITKLQSKNMQEFEKAINKIVGISSKMIESENPKLQELGKEMQDQAKSELIKSSGFTLSDEKDTFRNRLSREIRGNRPETDASEQRVTGIGKIRGFFSDTKNEIKRGFGAAVEEGSFVDRVFTSDEEKRQRLLSRVDETANESKTESLTESFKKVVEEILKQKETQDPTKSDTNKPSSKSDPTKSDTNKPSSKSDPATPDTNKPSSESDSEEQEDRAGISKDASITALEKTAESSLIIQENTTESNDTLKEMLKLMQQISEKMDANNSQNGDDMGGGMIPDIGLPERRRGGRRGGTRPRSVRGRARLARMNARGMGRSLGNFGRGALGLASKAAVPLTVAYGAYDAISGFQNAAENEKAQTAQIDKKVASGEMTKEQAAKAKSEVKKQGRVEKGGAIGGGVGMAGGAIAGASLGATIGSVVPGIGTAIGGVAGGVIGGIAGSGAGQWLGEKAGSAINWFKGDETPKQGKVSGKVTPQPNQEGFFSRNKGMMAGAALGPVGMAAGALYDKMTGTRSETSPNDAPKSSNRGMRVGAALGPIGMLGGALYDRMTGTSAKTETGRNVDGALIEAGTQATKEKMQINVPPPTVIQQGSSGNQESAPNITFPGGVRNVRSDDPTWLRFQHRRATA